MGDNSLSLSFSFSVCFLRCVPGARGRATISCPSFRWPRHVFPVASLAVCDTVSTYIFGIVASFGHTVVLRYAGGVVDALPFMCLFQCFACVYVLFFVLLYNAPRTMWGEWCCMVFVVVHTVGFDLGIDLDS